MRAAVFHRYGPPGVLTIAEVEKPTSGDDQALARVVAAADCEDVTRFNKQ
jgi:NADPH:quinone reductase-like Zn-dependent oxidoreductase